jgi:hypothetical protein
MRTWLIVPALALTLGGCSTPPMFPGPRSSEERQRAEEKKAAEQDPDASPIPKGEANPFGD